MLPSGLPELVADEEALARFLTSSSQFNASGVKHAAFLPNPTDQKRSVFRHGAEPLDGLKQIARDRIASAVHGAAICRAADVREAELDVIAEEPPPLHANIEGWPIILADRELQKAAQKERAMLVASKCALIRFESKTP
jgi:hypothetical protein